MAQKTAIINFKIDPDTKEQFNSLCESNFTTPSHELRQFVHNKIKELLNK